MSTGIVWTDETWNPTTGCDRVSPGCDNCYALKMAGRLRRMGQVKYQRDGDPGTSGPGFGITEHPDALELPTRWKKPRQVFVNSMSDLFHQGVSDEFIVKVFAVMSLTPQHTYQVLTKRHARMRSLLSSDAFPESVARALLTDPMFCQPPRTPPWPIPRGGLPWPLPNVHLGVSAEDQHWADIRVPALLNTPAAVRWVSAEPLLGPVDFSHWLSLPGEPQGLGWTVVGGESGPGARPMDLAWAEGIVAQFKTAGVPVLVKQLGTVTGGRDHHDMATFPESLRVREYPQPVSP